MLIVFKFRTVILPNESLSTIIRYPQTHSFSPVSIRFCPFLIHNLLSELFFLLLVNREVCLCLYWSSTIAWIGTISKVLAKVV